MYRTYVKYLQDAIEGVTHNLNYFYSLCSQRAAWHSGAFCTLVVVGGLFYVPNNTLSE